MIKVNPISLAPAEDLESLRRNVEQQINRLVQQINNSGISTNLDVRQHRIENVIKPVNARDAANKAYVDGQISEVRKLIVHRNTSGNGSDNSLGNPILHERAQSSLIMTTSVADVPDCEVTLTRDGEWLVIGVFHITPSGATDDNQNMYGLLHNGTTSDTVNICRRRATTAEEFTMSQVWQITGTSGQVLKLQAFKAGGSGISNVTATMTCITAIWCES